MGHVESCSYRVEEKQFDKWVVSGHPVYKKWLSNIIQSIYKRVNLFTVHVTCL